MFVRRLIRTLAATCRPPRGEHVLEVCSQALYDSMRAKLEPRIFAPHRMAQDMGYGWRNTCREMKMMVSSLEASECLVLFVQAVYFADVMVLRFLNRRYGRGWIGIGTAGTSLEMQGLGRTVIIDMAMIRNDDSSAPYNPKQSNGLLRQVEYASNGLALSEGSAWGKLLFEAHQLECRLGWAERKELSFFPTLDGGVLRNTDLALYLWRKIKKCRLGKSRFETTLCCATPEMVLASAGGLIPYRRQFVFTLRQADGSTTELLTRELLDPASAPLLARSYLVAYRCESGPEHQELSNLDVLALNSVRFGEGKPGMLLCRTTVFHLLNYRWKRPRNWFPDIRPVDYLPYLYAGARHLDSIGAQTSWLAEHRASCGNVSMRNFASRESEKQLLDLGLHEDDYNRIARLHLMRTHHHDSLGEGSRFGLSSAEQEMVLTIPEGARRLSWEAGVKLRVWWPPEPFDRFFRAFQKLGVNWRPVEAFNGSDGSLSFFAQPDELWCFGKARVGELLEVGSLGPVCLALMRKRGVEAFSHVLLADPCWELAIKAFGGEQLVDYADHIPEELITQVAVDVLDV